MDARNYWNHYVEQQGGPPAVSAKLSIPYSTIAGICNGSRGIGHKLAQRMAAADPMLDQAKLVWVRAIKPEGQVARRTPAANEGDAASTNGTPAALKDAA